MDIPNELRPIINDYKLNIINMSHLSAKQVKLFKSGFRIVADDFVQRRTNRSYTPSPEKLIHGDEVLKLIAALTKNDRF